MPNVSTDFRLRHSGLPYTRVRRFQQRGRWTIAEHPHTYDTIRIGVVAKSLAGTVHRVPPRMPRYVIRTRYHFRFTGSGELFHDYEAWLKTTGLQSSPDVPLCVHIGGKEAQCTKEWQYLEGSQLATYSFLPLSLNIDCVELELLPCTRAVKT
jgi:hypothetical protein